jgi:biopolymer transport protein ExbD/biopolymer transport protein TolR
MNRMLEVCLVGLSLLANSTLSLAAQALRQGISVQLAETHNAVAVPAADQDDSLIVTVTRDGKAYLGIAPVSCATLAEELRRSLANRKDKTVYIKADARGPYADVAQVLQAVHSSGVERPVLLTAQRDATAPGKLVSPKGLEVLIASRAPEDSGRVIVQILKSGPQPPRILVNGEPMARSALRGRLRELLQKQEKKVVFLKTEERLSFADVAALADACRSAGARLVLQTPQA